MELGLQQNDNLNLGEGHYVRFQHVVPTGNK